MGVSVDPAEVFLFLAVASLTENNISDQTLRLVTREGGGGLRWNAVGSGIILDSSPCPSPSAGVPQGGFGDFNFYL